MAELINLANGKACEKHNEPNYKAKRPASPSALPEKRVIVATNVAETAVTFYKCWICIDTCMVNQITASLETKRRQESVSG